MCADNISVSAHIQILPYSFKGPPNTEFKLELEIAKLVNSSPGC